MGLSELTNKELKNILRQNNIKNYSKLNKKDLTKKVNQLIKLQNNAGKKINGGYNSNTKNTSVPINVKTNLNKKNIPPSPELEQTSNVKNVKFISNNENLPPVISSTESAGQLEPTVKNNQREEVESHPITSETNQSNPNQNVTQANNKKIPSAPPYNKKELNELNNREFNRKTQIAINESKSNQNLKKEECGACTIL
jgi:hypothetical protein